MTSKQINFFCSKSYFELIIDLFINDGYWFSPSRFSSSSDYRLSYPFENEQNICHQFFLLKDANRVIIKNIKDDLCTIDQIDSEVIEFTYSTLERQQFLFENIRLYYKSGYFENNIWKLKSNAFLEESNKIFLEIRKLLIRNKLINYYVSPDLDEQILKRNLKEFNAYNNILLK